MQLLNNRFLILFTNQASYRTIAPLLKYFSNLPEGQRLEEAIVVGKPSSVTRRSQVFTTTQATAFDNQMEARLSRLRRMAQDESTCSDLRIGRELIKKPFWLLGLAKVTSCIVLRKTGMTDYAAGFYERRTTTYLFLHQSRETYSIPIRFDGRGYDFYHFTELYEIGLDDVVKAIELLRAKVPLFVG